jgi:hypothetical protein
MSKMRNQRLNLVRSDPVQKWRKKILAEAKMLPVWRRPTRFSVVIKLLSLVNRFLTNLKSLSMLMRSMTLTLLRPTRLWSQLISLNVCRLNSKADFLILKRPS